MNVNKNSKQNSPKRLRYPLENYYIEKSMGGDEKTNSFLNHFRADQQKQT